jgi:hypothetical protein
MRLRSCDIHIVIKLTCNRSARQEVQIRHIQENALYFRHPGGKEERIEILAPGRDLKTNINTPLCIENTI